MTLGSEAIVRSQVTLFVLFTLFASLTFAGPAISAEKSTAKTNEMLIKRPKAGGTTVMGDAPVALTSEECTQLGGTINAYEGACKSGQACQRTGEDGKFYSVCISQLK